MAANVKEWFLLISLANVGNSHIKYEVFGKFGRIPTAYPKMVLHQQILIGIW